MYTYIVNLAGIECSCVHEDGVIVECVTLNTYSQTECMTYSQSLQIVANLVDPALGLLLTGS